MSRVNDTYGAYTKITVTTAGAGYTCGAGFRLRGGIPITWTSPASASCTLDSDGFIDTFTIDDGGGGGYEYTATNLYANNVFYLDGGGDEVGSIAPAGIVVGQQYYPTGTEGAAKYAQGSDISVYERKFKNPPRVVIV